MKVFAVAGNPELATVYMADMGGGRMMEFVEACQPPYGREERWILMVSTLYGCPVKCLFCDAGGGYRGKPTKDEILAQIDYMVAQWFPDSVIPASKFKIQFARMGEPSLNMATLDALEELPRRYKTKGVVPSISTVAPLGTDEFFDRLLEVKNRLYPNGKFQLQFSIHTTDEKRRDELIPIRKWGFARMADYGQKFYRAGDRKITLNFALAADSPVETDVLTRYFDPALFLIKLTPINPTSRAAQNNVSSFIDPLNPDSAQTVVEKLRRAGYQTIVSVGEAEENEIGSNCGQYVLNYLESGMTLKGGYTYAVRETA